jgi:hypothetical protein
MSDRREYQRAWQKANPEKMKKYYKKYRETHLQIVRKRGREWSRRFRQQNPEKVKSSVRNANAFAKHELLAAYGGPICVCCGESETNFLTLDHINQDGASHRNRHGGSSGLYIWLRQNGYPDDPPLQVLCWNCQWGRRKNNGVCPHEEESQ